MLKDCNSAIVCVAAEFAGFHAQQRVLDLT